MLCVCKESSFCCCCLFVLIFALLEQKASGLLPFFNLQCSPGCCLEYLSHTLLGLGRAFQIGKGINFLSHSASLLRLNRLLLHLCQILRRVYFINLISIYGIERGLTRIVLGSFRKSFLLPTKMIGTLGQKCLTCSKIEFIIIKNEIDFCLMVYGLYLWRPFFGNIF